MFDGTKNLAEEASDQSLVCGDSVSLAEAVVDFVVPSAKQEDCDDGMKDLYFIISRRLQIH